MIYYVRNWMKNVFHPISLSIVIPTVKSVSKCRADQEMMYAYSFLFKVSQFNKEKWICFMFYVFNVFIQWFQCCQWFSIFKMCQWLPFYPKLFDELTSFSTKTRCGSCLLFFYCCSFCWFSSFFWTERWNQSRCLGSQQHRLHQQRWRQHRRRMLMKFGTLCKKF